MAGKGFELWDMVSGNLLDYYDTQQEAVDTIRQLIELNGSGTTEDLALVFVDSDDMTTISKGPALEEYVMHRGTEQPRRTA